MTDTEVDIKEVEKLREELKKLHTEKENWYAKKKEVSKKVSGLIAKIKDHRDLRDQLTKDVQGAKIKRKDLNKGIREKIERIKVLQSKKTEASKASGTKGKVPSPQVLLRDIKRLQYKIETEGLDFEQEKKIMKVIKEKNDQYQDTREFKDLFKEVQTLSKEIDELKKHSDEIHSEIQGKATDSQKYHETMLGLSEDVDKLKEAEHEASEKFKEFKTQYNDLTKKLKDITGDDEKEIPRKRTPKKPDEAEKKRKKMLKAQEEEVRAKILRGETLTTEDLFIYQNMDEDDESLDSDKKE